MESPLYLEPMQTRDEPPTPYERKLAGLIHAIFSEGHETLPALVGALNERGSTAPDGSEWTEETFRAEMRRLGE
ncbi:hypothetical protein BHE97_11025 [Aeromicrobium sp. PE09-221]|uniref:recombinase-like helix-turn-helix domain-containing protein n=1 Tax=Aeromicrobium sp. PE09-221 TaxID=1898043 RepID=UPI000B3E9BFD|nr:recombinase-like helix-turn-helix domain-containing protein [Aeromicrobium sp. PE09-221]OUZ09253.1 hypothetical protein BHE97_11025 [Aeromicrobium sp. PE09-221]